jgi:aspartyl-tRNA(Asn)/glutamyl-tRNA(Gln) amidotransferase subunit B
VDGIRADLPELPDCKKDRFVSEYELAVEDAGLLTTDRATADFYEEVAEGRDPKLACNWVTGELFGVLNKSGGSITDSPVSTATLGGLIDLIDDGTLSGRLAKDVFEIMVETGKEAALVVEEKGLKQVSDSGAIEAEVDKIMTSHADKVAEYKAGKDKLFGFFVGQVMKTTGGKANPGVVNEVLKKKLGG